MLLEEAIRQVRQEGYAVIGCYLNEAPDSIEIVHFAAPTLSRSGMTQMVRTWLEVLEDNNIHAERVESDNKPKLYQA